MIRRSGVTYDTGFFNLGTSTREPFVERDVERELRIIHDDLHCDAVRVTGGDRDRLEVAARHAASAGLEVWYCPFTNELTDRELLAFVSDAAVRAEKLRNGGADVVLVTGSEISVFTRGFLPGDTLADRLASLGEPETLRSQLPQLQNRVNAFLGEVVAAARQHFRGPLTYASLPFEAVDWSPFDFVASDAAYGSPTEAGRFETGIAALAASGKPVAITEFGCTTYRGASANPGRGDQIVEWQGSRPVRLTGTYVRDEPEQARCVVGVLRIFEAAGVDTAFVNTFARYDLPHRSGAREDLDLASYGLVKVYEGRSGERYADLPWEPKAAFDALARWNAGRG